jgi:DNA mismatch repair protein MutL
MPDVINLAPREAKIVQDYIPLLQQMGLDIESFGENAFVVKAVPAMLPDLDPMTLIRDIIDDDAGRERSPHLHERKDRLLAMMACRGAVKAKHALSPAEAAALCQAMDKSAFVATCPHGRPTYVSILTKELERMFKRK